jgi:hypothetical protein
MATSEYNIVDINPLYRENTVMISDNYDHLASYYPTKDKGSTYYKLMTGLPLKYGRDLNTPAQRQQFLDNKAALLTRWAQVEKERNLIMNQITKLA